MMAGKGREQSRATDSVVLTDATTPVLVLECHHGSLGIARSLGRLGVPVYGVDADLTVPALRSRYFKQGFAWDLVTSPPETSADFLIYVAGRIGRRAILIPTSDETTILVAQYADVLRHHFDFVDQPADLIRRLASKRENYLLAQSLDIPVPETEFPTSLDEVRDFTEHATFPVMLKGIDGRKLYDRTGMKMVIAHTAEALLDLYPRMENPDQPNLMLQEYIPGGDDTIWIFNGYFNRQSSCVASFTGRKLRQTPPHMGSTSLGICEPAPDVERMTIRFMQAVEYRGILDIGYRYDARDGNYKLLDPNPRIGSTFRLFVDNHGMDVARHLYADLTNQPVRTDTPRWGRKWVVEDSDLESYIVYRREGTLGFRDWVRSFRGVEEGAWFARDDLKPMIPIAWQVIKQMARWVWKRTLRKRSASTNDHLQPAESSAENTNERVLTG